MRTFRNLAFGTTIAATMLVASPANAAIVLCYEVGSDTPQCPATDSNVNVDTVTGSVVTGWLNDDHAQLLTFTSLNPGAETLVGDGSGQATVSAVDGLLNNAVQFALTGQTFNAITFNLVPLAGNSPADEATSVQISYIPADGNSPITYTLSGNGNNFWGLYGTEGEQIQSITWGNYLPEGNGIESIKQVRVGGLQGPGAVPEPATWAMLLIGFGAIGGTLRTRKSATAGKRLRVA